MSNMMASGIGEPCRLTAQKLQILCKRYVEIYNDQSETILKSFVHVSHSINAGLVYVSLGAQL